MNKIAELNPLKTPISEYKKFKVRNAVRAIILDDQKNIALVHVSCGDYYKIPGGGVDSGEDKILALKRECLEEAGVEITNIQELGFIKEINGIVNLMQNSFCYVVNIFGDKKIPEFTKKEIEKGFSLKWIPSSEAIKIMTETETIGNFEKHMKKRDILFVKEFFNKT